MLPPSYPDLVAVPVTVPRSFLAAIPLSRFNIWRVGVVNRTALRLLPPAGGSRP